MSGWHRYTLFCDTPDCEARFEGGDTLSSTRKAAAKDGWSSRLLARRGWGPPPSADFCPAHPSTSDADALSVYQVAQRRHR